MPEGLLKPGQLTISTGPGWRVVDSGTLIGPGPIEMAFNDENDRWLLRVVFESSGNFQEPPTWEPRQSALTEAEIVVRNLGEFPGGPYPDHIQAGPIVIGSIGDQLLRIGLHVFAGSAADTYVVHYCLLSSPIPFKISASDANAS